MLGGMEQCCSLDVQGKTDILAAPPTPCNLSPLLDGFRLTYMQMSKKFN
jgi:hypothetical protein